MLLAACGPQNDSETDESEEESGPTIPVEVQNPDRGTVYAMYSGTAPIEAIAEATVIAKVAGEIRELRVEEGDAVARGEILAALDGDRLALELRESEAQLEKLNRDFKRNTELKAKGLISDGDFDKLRYEMEALEASYNLAKLELDYTRIRASIDGVISERFARLGNTVAVGDPLFRITSFDPLVAYLYVPEREYRRIAPGKPVGIQIDALGKTPIIASVTRVSPVVDPETGTFKITVEIRDSEQRIKPGMFARLSVIYDQRDNALRIPRAALVDNDGSLHVYIVEDGKAVRKSVETGFSNEGLVEVRSGLDENDRVVVVGQLGLKEGTNVSIIGEEKEPDVEESADTEDAETQTARSRNDERSQ